MSKNLKKFLITSASLLMLASVGVGVSQTHVSANTFNKLTSLMRRDHARSFPDGTDEGLTIRHNGKKITVTMTHAYINGHKVSYGTALHALHQRARKHYRKHIKKYHRRSFKRLKHSKKHYLMRY